MVVCGALPGGYAGRVDTGYKISRIRLKLSSVAQINMLNDKLYIQNN